MNTSYILNHLGEDNEQYFGAIAPPIIQSSNFAFPTVAAFREAIAQEYDSHVYTRGNNPTVKILRQKLAALEGTEDALVLSSGSAAVAATLISQVQAGDHIVCVDAPYSWTKILLQNFLSRFGVTYTYVDGTSIAAIEAAIQDNTKVLYLESPNSLTFECQDLAKCAALARQYGLTSIIDNSYASPIFQQPAQLGIDLVVHSGTKYLNGHSDVVVGVVCGDKAKLEQIFADTYMTLGPIISPNDAAMVLRGLRTLELRMQRTHQSGLYIAQQLEQHPKVKQVIHPFLPSFPQYDLVQQQMKGAGGLFSAHFKANSIEEMEAFSNKLVELNRMQLAVSWGGHESLIIPSATFHNMPDREDSPIPWTLVRFYIGLEDPQWLWEGIEEALLLLN